MDAVTMIGMAALAVLGLTCGALALWCEYRDGVVGHLCLATVATLALYAAIDATENEYELLPVTAGVFVAMAVFMLRHALRAWRFRGRARE